MSNRAQDNGPWLDVHTITSCYLAYCSVPDMPFLLPHTVEQFHEAIIYHEGDGHVQTHTAQPGHGPFVKPESKIKFLVQGTGLCTLSEKLILTFIPII